MDDLDAGSPRIDDLRRDLMRAPDEAAAMVRLKGLGWGVRRIAAEFGCSRETVRRYVKAGGLRRIPGAAAGEGAGRARGHSWSSGSGAIAATPTWCGRTWRASSASPCRCARSSARWRVFARRCGRRRGPACGSRRRRGGSFRSTSARRGSRSAARPCGSTCSWRRSAIRGGSSCRRSGTSGSRPGSTGSRAAFAHFGGAAAGGAASTTRGRWSTSTTRRPARCGSTRGSSRSPATGVFGRGPARRIGRAPRARTSAASAT